MTLKKIAKILKYKDAITWYAARGTFITKMIESDIPYTLVAQMAGNSPSTIDRHYLKSTVTKEMNAKIRSII